MKTIVNFYNTNSYFHSFVIAMEMAIVSFVTSYDGGLPTTKSALVSLAFAVGGALWAALKRWLATNVATVGVVPKNGN
jgi:hypothetical protein